jgi:preprotein translocase subunit SecG
MREIIQTPLAVIHIIACLFLILVVLVQPGKSGGLGAFTGAAATQVFGGRGAGNFLTKTTWVTATVFFLSSISLAYLSSSSDESLAKKSETVAVTAKPTPLGAPSAAAPASAAAPSPAPPPAAPVAPPSAEVPVAPAPSAAAPSPAAPAPSAVPPSSAAPKPAKPKPKPAKPKPAVPAQPSPAAPAPAPEPAAPAPQ